MSKAGQIANRNPCIEKDLETETNRQVKAALTNTRFTTGCRQGKLRTKFRNFR